MVVGLPESTVKAFQVRQNRIPWGISQVQVKVVVAKPANKNIKEKKGAGKKSFMASSGNPFSQINLQHSKSSSAVLASSMAQLHAGICLIQEPWLRGGNMKGLSGVGRLFRDPSQCEPRACILLKGCESSRWTSQGSKEL